MASNKKFETIDGLSSTGVATFAANVEVGTNTFFVDVESNTIFGNAAEFVSGISADSFQGKINGLQFPDITELPVDSNFVLATGNVDQSELKWVAIERGDTGFTGSRGLVGDTGFTGSRGVQGDQGVTGFNGSRGDLGFAGSRGFAGADGFTGSIGLVGATGFNGSKGDVGFNGSRGDVGFNGSRGVDGFTGSVGLTGSMGVQGFNGSRGLVGDTGFTGSIGFSGSRGVTGFTGSQGIQGIPGTTGFTGSRGVQGIQGPIGFTGSRGFSGDQGPIGFTGSRGFAGANGFNGSRGFTGSQGPGANQALNTNSNVTFASVTATGEITAFSDRRLKENIVTIENAIEKVKNLRGVYFTRNDEDTEKRHVGVIAQEILDVLPEVVKGSGENYYSVAYGNIVALLIEAIKELIVKFEKLENK